MAGITALATIGTSAACSSMGASRAGNGLPERRCISLSYDTASLAVALPRLISIAVEEGAVRVRWLPSPLDTIGYQRMFQTPVALAEDDQGALMVRFSNGFSWSQLTFASLRDSVRGTGSVFFDAHAGDPIPTAPFVGADVTCP
jgi:hypothetical protein